MRILLIKTSSLGDIIHTFPAVYDAVVAHPSIQIDWLVEEGFTDLPKLHPAVGKVIALPWRRLRGQLWKPSAWRALKDFVRSLQETHYDLVIDAQGLLKSAVWTYFIDAPSWGLDSQSAREPIASRFYTHKAAVPWGQHAITRVRQLFAQALNYPLPDMQQVNYGLIPKIRALPEQDALPYWVFAHATTWESKHWPEPYWQTLILFAAQHKRRIYLPWSSDQERMRAERFARLTHHVVVLPEMTLSSIARVLTDAELIVGVDTGLTHLAAALHKPVIALYGATEPGLTGVVGQRVTVLQAKYPCAPCLREMCIELEGDSDIPPCYATDLPAERVIKAIEQTLSLANSVK
ncbi:MAG: lipopolysaccharide heptosyltransferase I [Thiotrichales bacterium]|jgi:heptosyltransferase-1|nr:lipopolysaccharide heptosyltransferase I [Thiotrichales bacterium]